MEGFMYVVIGATGNTGSIVANKLLAQGKPVRVVGRHADRLKAFTAQGAEPFVGDVTDKDAMTKALTGAKAVYVMIPPKADAPDVYAYQKKVQESLAAAIEGNNVKYAVSLSSVGAERPDKTGPILGLHHLEQRLNGIAGLNVLHLRPAYFMENLFTQVDAIAYTGGTVGTLSPTLKLPMIATRDIASRAANALLSLDFMGQQFQDLQGERDLSFAEITSVTGKAIGKTDLRYAQLSGEQFGGMLLQAGLSKNMCDLLVEMGEGLESGYIKPAEARSARNTTPTSIETFVTEEFVPAYRTKTAA
jgi:uncharacterized protein YbjT (DUF2867 family)